MQSSTVNDVVREGKAWRRHQIQLNYWHQSQMWLSQIR